MYRKFFCLLLTTLLFICTFPISTNANENTAPSVEFINTPIGPCGPGAPSGRFANLCSVNITADKTGVLIRNSIIAALVIAALLALFFLIWGGFKWITSGGDKTQIDAAKKMLIAAILGLVLSLLAFFVISVVLGLFNIHLSDLRIPTLPTK